MRGFAGLQFGQERFFEFAPFALRAYHNSEIGALDDRSGFCHAHFSQCAAIVDAAGVDEQDRPDGEQFHGFFDGIGSRSRELGDDRHFLARQCVEQ
jgi:hypothetical protein